MVAFTEPEHDGVAGSLPGLETVLNGMPRADGYVAKRRIASGRRASPSFKT